MTGRNIIVNLFYYGMTAVAAPAAVLWAENKLGIAFQPRAGVRVAGAVAIAAGAMLQAWCIVLFQRVGGGTPSPAIPTQRLVTQGPYRYVRNPMNLGEVLVFLGLAGWFGSPGLLLYAMASWLAFHAFIVLYEEPRNTRAFGAAYGAYRAAVRRWVPRKSERAERSHL